MTLTWMQVFTIHHVTSLKKEEVWGGGREAPAVASSMCHVMPGLLALTVVETNN